MIYQYLLGFLITAKRCTVATHFFFFSFKADNMTEELTQSNIYLDDEIERLK
jgi:hypothetical protein